MLHKVLQFIRDVSPSLISAIFSAFAVAGVYEYLYRNKIAEHFKKLTKAATESDQRVGEASLEIVLPDKETNVDKALDVFLEYVGNVDAKLTPKVSSTESKAR